MIRDPSDGSVKDPFDYESVPAKSSKTISVIVTDMGRADAPVIDTSASGLPITKAKADYLRRLEESRDWLKEYFKPKDNA